MSLSAIKLDKFPFTDVERGYQTQMIIKLFEHWKLTIKQQAILLGLSPNTESSIHNYKTGKGFLPLQRDIQDRVKYLFGIHKLLRRAYPKNKELAYKWLTTPNTDFNSLKPIELVHSKGLLGLDEIKHYLEMKLN